MDWEIFFHGPFLLLLRIVWYLPGRVFHSHLSGEKNIISVTVDLSSDKSVSSCQPLSASPIVLTYTPYTYPSELTSPKQRNTKQGALDKKDYTIIKPPETVWFGGEFNIWAFISKISWAVVSITLWVALISIILLSDADALLKIQSHSDTPAPVWL